jgi:hypothetical protein
VSVVGPAAGLADGEIRELDRTVEEALASGEQGGLQVLGSGEISLVLGWPAAEPAFACKRLPAFPDRTRFAAYERTLADYVRALGAAGVDVVDTAFMPVEHGDGSVIGYAVQPVLPAETLVPRILAAAGPGDGHPVVEAIVARIRAVVSPHLGIDAQLSNWTWEEGGRLRYLDVTTPMLWSQDGRPLLDIELLTLPLPAILRPPIRRFLGPRILDGYRDLRGVMSDLCGNLLKERLDPWVPVFLGSIEGALDPPMSEEEVRRYYRSDARLWEFLLRLRRLDRTWHRRVRRRAYPYLLPAKVER